jgi:hypothetical protein
MKSFYSILIAFCSLFIFTTANAQGSCFINGPTECQLPQTNITYVGNHDFCSSGCTKYVWHVTNGSFVIDGAVVPCNTIEMTEDIFNCPTFGPCDPIVPISSCGQVPIIVRWNEGVSTGKLRLTVKEEGSIALSATKEITVKLVDKIDDLIQTGVTCSIATYKAATDFGSCMNDIEIVWFRKNGNNFSLVGSGPTFTDSPNFDDVTYRVDLVLHQGNINKVLNSITKTFNGIKPKTILGPNTMGQYTSMTFPLNAPAVIANWSLYNSCSYISYSTNCYADVTTNCVPGTYFPLNVTGSWMCGNFSATKWITVSNGGGFGGGMSGSDSDLALDETTFGKAMDRSDLEQTVEAPKVTFDVTLFPVPVTQSRIEGSIEGAFDEGQVRVIDMSGREVFQSNISGVRFDLNLPELTPGVYILQVIAPNGIVSRKFDLIH